MPIANSKTERPYSGQPRAERRRARRVKLIAAGFELFGSIGFNQTKVDQLCARAGVGIRSLYEEFENLEGAFKAVYDDVIEHAYTAVESALVACAYAPSAERLSIFIHTYLHHMLDDRRCGRIVSIESARLDEILGTYRNQALNRFADLIASIPVTVPGGFDGDLRVWSLLLAGGLNETVIDGVLATTAPDIDALSAEIAKIYSRTLVE